jgi:acyl transferase domain-containing protein
LPTKRALQALEEMQSNLQASENAQHEPSAIIDMGCRFPGANNPEEFWKLLRDGLDAISEVQKNRWDIDGCYNLNPDEPGKMYTRSGGFVEQFDESDPNFLDFLSEKPTTYTLNNACCWK